MSYDANNTPKYDPRFGAYKVNESALGFWRNAYFAQANGERQAKILVCGDSISAQDGTGAQTYATNVGGRLRTLINTRTGINCGSGLVGNQMVSGPLAVSLTGSWAGSTFSGAVGTVSNTAGDAVSISFTAAATGTLRVTAQNSNTGSASAVLDGGTAVTITSNLNGSMFNTDFAVTAGAHTLVITNNSGRFYLFGLNLIYTTTGGIQVSNISNSGAAAWAYGAGLGPAALSNYAPDLILLPIGTNASATAVSDIITMLGTAGVTNASVALLTPPFDSNGSTLRAGYYGIADAYPNVCVIDQYRLLTGYISGMSRDGTHPTDRGTHYLASNYYRVIFSQVAP